MLEFKKNIDERKLLVRKLEELTGESSVYTRAPEYAYLVGDYKVDREGNLQVNEDTADQSVLVALLTEGMITMPEEGDIEEEETVETEPAEETELTEELAEEAGGLGERELNEEIEPTEEHEAQETATEEATEEPIVLHISFPAEKHTGLSLRNLVYMIHSRAELINKAIGAHFKVDDGLIDALKDDACTFSQLNFRKAVGAYEDEHGLSMEGLVITPEEITFTGFAAGMDADHCKACTDLAAAMNKMAIEQKRVQPTAKLVENEKYALRIWLVRMGMGGDEYKLTRKLLMENLTGHTAFRTPEEAERAKEKARRKREEQKAEAAAATGENVETEMQEVE